MRRQRYNHDKLKVVGKRRFDGNPYSDLEDPFISWVNYDQDYEWSNTFPYESPFWNWNWNYISQNAPQPLLPSQISPIIEMTERPVLQERISPQIEITAPEVNATSGNWFKNLGAKAGEAFKSGALNDTMVAAGDLVYKGLTGDKNVGTGVGNTMSKLGDIPLATFGPWGAVAQGALKVLGGLSNAAFGSTYNYENINAFKKDTAEANANTATLSDYDSIMNNNWNHAHYANKSYFGKDGWFTNRVGKMARRLNTISGRAQDRERLAQAVSTQQVGLNTLQGLERQWYAQGGRLNKFYGGGDDNEEQNSSTYVQRPLVVEQEMPNMCSEEVYGSPVYYPAQGEHAYEQAERAWYRDQRRRAGQAAGTFRRDDPNFYPSTMMPSNASALDRMAAIYINNSDVAAMYNPATDNIVYDGSYYNGAPFSFYPDDKNHEWEHANQARSGGSGLPIDLKKSFNAYIDSLPESDDYWRSHNIEKLATGLGGAFADGELRATLSSLKDYQKKLYGDEMTFADLSDEVIDGWIKAVADDFYVQRYAPWIKTLPINLKRALLRYMNIPQNVTSVNLNPESRLNGNQRLAAEGGDLQSPRTAIDAPLVNRLYMNKATNNVRRAANALGLPVMSNPYLNTPYAYGGKVNRLDGTEDSWLLGGVGIAADRTGKPLGYMVQKNYDPSSYEYNALGKTADQYISRTGSRTDEQYAIKDAQKVEEAKRNYNRSHSAFNGYELTDQFNKHVVQPIAKAVAGGAGGLWNEIKDKPVLMMTGDPSISYAGNAYYRTPAEQAQDVGNFFNHTVVGNVLKGLGNGVFSVLTPSKDLGVLTSIDNAIRNRDPNYLVAPWSKDNYGLARYPGDKRGETLNMMVDIPTLFIGGKAAAKTASKADNVVQAANTERAVRTAQRLGAADKVGDITTTVTQNGRRIMQIDHPQTTGVSAAMVEEGSTPIVRKASTTGPAPAAAKQIITINLAKMTPDERLQAGINPTTGSLYEGYMDAMYNISGMRLKRGIQNPEVGYWDVDKTPVFSVNLDDPQYWRNLKVDLEDLKNNIDRSLFANPSVIDTWTPVSLTNKASSTAIGAFFKTDQGKKFKALAEKYGLAPDEIYKVAERSILENITRNSHAWYNYIRGKYMPYITLEMKQASDAQRSSWGDRLYMRIRRLIKRHEQGHVATHTTATEMPNEVIESLSSFYKNMPILRKYFTGNKGTEVAQRFSQVKDLYLLKPGENLTWDQFLYGLKNYKRLTGYDNNMTDLYQWAVTVKDPKLQNMILGHFNNPKNAYNIVGPLALTVGATGAAAASQAEGGSLRAGLDTALNN